MNHKNIVERSLISKKGDLKYLGMKNGELYECIITTENPDKTSNAAPIGVLCKDPEHVILYLYDGTHTLENIKRSNFFVVNLTKNSLIFTKTTLSDISEDNFKYYKEYPYIEEADAFFMVKTEKIKDITKNNSLGSANMSIITGKVKNVVKIKEFNQPLNRGIYAVIESLIHYTRMNLADKNTQISYWGRIKEMNRVVQKVGSKEDKLSMKEIITKIKSEYNNLE
ncbi:DUF447 domain-containing protein [Methanobacterium alcaliphilum]|uniref:DUF447 domain-containing protein n=1 Tax=Methanobacterium alcaliphilum TaxID=392018 RepID=UPI00200A6DB5|nr:DUF447 domain-containing protein [Methanobacterium alcaliphilum]MCK9150926.1 DUF447 family protein [Methanobacterium alcaliphilum]